MPPPKSSSSNSSPAMMLLGVGLGVGRWRSDQVGDEHIFQMDHCLVRRSVFHGAGIGAGVDRIGHEVANRDLPAGVVPATGASRTAGAAAAAGAGAGAAAG